MAYVLGYFAADGCMFRAKLGGYSIEFTSTDYILLQNVQKAARSNHQISERKRRNEKWKTQYRLQIGSKIWFEDLTTLGFTTCKSTTLHFPNPPKAYLGHFVRGYFDGDGCVYFRKLQFADRKNPRHILMTLFTSGSRSFLESLTEALRHHGVQGGHLLTKERGFDFRFSHRDSLALYELMYNTAQVVDLFLPRKREKLEHAIQVLKLRLDNAVVV